MFDEITDKENIYRSYKLATKSKGKFSAEAIKFAENETYNLKELRRSLIDETYCFDGYIKFPVYEPKERIVYAPHFKDKIVQLAINSILKKTYNPTFIFDSYACIDGKGTHKCAKQIQRFLKRAKWEYGDDAYIVKIDIKKFFYSIDREILKQMLPKKIKCKRTLGLIYKIIDSADAIDDKGLPLGNTLSQICANIYLNKADQYCKRKLRIKYMARYADDFILVLPNKEAARETLIKTEEFINEKLKLELNKEKSKIFPLRQGVNVVGYKIHPTHMLLRNDCKKKIKRKAKAIPRLITEKKLSGKTAERMLNGFNGHAKTACSHNFMKDLIKKNDHLEIDSKGHIRMKEGKENEANI